jgi:predicted nucleic acid-binding protein
LARLSALPIEIDEQTQARAWEDTLHLADRFTLTFYDACYLELAQRTGLPLASLDRELRAAAAALGLELLGA